MGIPSQSSASLRISGDDLDPNEITQMLGHPASNSVRKGELEILPSGRNRIAATGRWDRRVDYRRRPGNLDRQIGEILAPLNDDLVVWQKISEKFKMDMFCGLFLESFNEGLVLAPNTLEALGRRGIKLGLDIYGEENDQTD